MPLSAHSRICWRPLFLSENSTSRPGAKGSLTLFILVVLPVHVISGQYAFGVLARASATGIAGGCAARVLRPSFAEAWLLLRSLLDAVNVLLFSFFAFEPDARV